MVRSLIKLKSKSPGDDNLKPARKRHEALRQIIASDVHQTVCLLEAKDFKERNP